MPEERLGRGAVPSISLSRNTLLTRTEAVAPFGWISVGRTAALARHLIARYNVKAGGADATAQKGPGATASRQGLSGRSDHFAAGVPPVSVSSSSVRRAMRATSARYGAGVAMSRPAFFTTRYGSLEPPDLSMSR